MKTAFTDILQNKCSQKLRKCTRKTPLLESLFNKVAGLISWNCIKKRPHHIYLRVSLSKFSKKLIYRTPPNDCSCWFLRSNQDFIHWSHFFRFSFIFFSFVIDNCNYGSLFRKVIKMNIFLLFAIIYTKNSMNIVKAVSPRQ